MAFCNSCGTTINPGIRFCSKCGAPILASTLPPQGGGSLKVILIAMVVIVLLGAIGLGSLAFFAMRIARHAHVRQDGDNVKVETPFGNVETSKDPADAARNVGVDLYPGAELQPDGSSSASFGSVHTSSLKAESTDPLEKVSSFYKSKFPNAVVTSSDAGRCTIVSNDHNNIITINIEAADGKTNIQITSVTHK
jgi:hypothetical protein